MNKKLIMLALVCLTFMLASAVQAKKKEVQLNPMESVVCPVDGDYVIVRNDETRRNTFTVRDAKTLEPAFDTKFEKYLDTFKLDGMTFIAIASWHPAFGYLWSAWIRKGKEWKQLLRMDYTDLKIIKEEGHPVRLQCTDHTGEQKTYTLQDLLSE